MLLDPAKGEESSALTTVLSKHKEGFTDVRREGHGRDA